MKFEYFTVIGLTTNLLLALLLPTLLLTDETQSNLGIESNAVIQDTSIIGQKQKTNTEEIYSTYTQESQTAELLNTDRQSTVLGSVSSFFDGLGDALKKIGDYFLLIIPFGSLLLALPNSLGFFLGTIFTFLYGFSFVNWIRGR